MKNSFISQVAQLLPQKGDELKSYTIVFPHVRALRVMTAALGAAAPKMLTISRLFSQYANMQEAPRAELIFRLYNAYQSVCKTRSKTCMTFDEFLPWAGMILDDFDDIDKALANPNDVFRDVKNLKDIDDIKFIDEDAKKSLKEYYSTFMQANDNAMRGKYHDMWSLLLPLYDEMNQQSSQTSYEGAIYKKGCASITASSGNEKFIFVGFNALTGAEVKVMSTLKKESRALFFWDHSPMFVNDDNVAVSSIKRDIQELGGWFPENEKLEDTPIKIVESTTLSGQALYTKSWLDKIDFNSKDFTAVLPLNDSLLPTMRHFIPTEKYFRPIKFPVSVTSTYSKIMLFISEKLKSGSTTTLEKHNFEELKTYIDSITIDSNAYDAELESQSLEAAKNAEETLSGLISANSGIKLSLASAAMLFKSLYEAKQATDEDSDDTKQDRTFKAEVLDMSDTLSIDYDNVLILNCNEGTLPSKSNKATMLPNIVRKVYKLPLHNANSGVTAYNFFRLLKRAKNVTLVYSSSQYSVGSNSEVSRFILQIVSQEIHRKYESIKLATPAKYVKPEKISIAKTEDMLESIKDMQPSPLYMFLECQLKFYYNKVLHIRPPKPDVKKMPANLLGSIFHKAMECYYSEKKDRITDSSVIESDLKNKINDEIKKCTDAALDEYEATGNGILENIIMQSMTNVLKYDKSSAPFKIKELESEKYTKFHLYNKYETNVGGIIDRIHTVGDNYIIVDYKTGKWKEPANAPKLEDVFTKPNSSKHYNYVLQALMYSLALYDELSKSKTSFGKIIPQYYFITAIGKSDFSPYIKIGKDDFDDFGKQAEDVRNMLQELLAKVYDISQDFVPTEDDNICRFCDYKLLCSKFQTK